MPQPNPSVSRDIVLDGPAIDVHRIISGLAIYLDVSAGTVDVEISPDGTNFITHTAAVAAGQTVILLPPCQKLQVVDNTSGAVNSLRWNGVGK